MKNKRPGYDGGRRRIIASAALGVQALLLIGWTLLSLSRLNPYAAAWDEVDFALALQRFDLLAMQPHFPGYPYFVLGAKLVHYWISDPVLAYDILNVALTLSSSVPLWFVARRSLSPAMSGLTVLIVLTAPYLWLQTVSPMSEAAGIAALWWYLWFLLEAMRRGRRRWIFGALALFGVVMGIRLSFAPFGLGLVWLGLLQLVRWRREGKRLLPRAAAYAGAAAGAQLLWVAGLVFSEGGPAGFVQLAGAFVAGHFSEWGGGIAASPMPPAERLLRFAGGNVLWTGWFARSTALMLAAAALLLAAVLRAGAVRPPRADAPAPRAVRGAAARALGRAADLLRSPPPAAALAALGTAYAVWALLAQNIDKPRHITPLVGILWLLVLSAFRSIGHAAPHTASGPAAIPPHGQALSGPSATHVTDPPPSAALRWLQASGIALASLVLAVQTGVGIALLSKQAAERPAVYQLADEVKRLSALHDSKVVVYTWEEARVLEWNRTPPVYREIYTYPYFLAQLAAQPHAAVYLTDHVLDGFRKQAGTLAGHAKARARFESSTLTDPVYGTITLYEWIR
ncbi:glycosyltransferase family 39 protein [Paenibacillus beijingensis]|uniref:glycosyltransferase family 39 protein n=1 Tax=Paenibacillus beijingensis TaxID=1126833 RepID=UPI000697559C|nr:glycosyltransferase family 39 protein [Paenibacillus beijingensis]